MKAYLILEDGTVFEGTSIGSAREVISEIVFNTSMTGYLEVLTDPEGENENFYADDIVYYVINNNSGYSGDLELALIPESFLKDILHEEEDANGVMAENATVSYERFALLFEFSGDAKAIRHVLYCCSASRPAMEGQTAEDEKEVQTETLTLSATALANGYVKAKTSANTSEEVYNSWYDAVYEPQQTALEPDAGEEEEIPQG